MSNELDPDEISRDDETKSCPNCNGTGDIESFDKFPEGLTVDCPMCKGARVISTKPPEPRDNWAGDA